MKFRNTSDQPLDFEVDGDRYTAAPGGLLTPDVPHEKLGGFRRIHGLPIEEAWREPKPPGAPVVRYHGPVLRSHSDHALSFLIDGEHHSAPPRGIVTPDVHPTKVAGVLKMGLPIRIEDAVQEGDGAPLPDASPGGSADAGTLNEEGDDDLEDDNLEDDNGPADGEGEGSADAGPADGASQSNAHPRGRGRRRGR